MQKPGMLQNMNMDKGKMNKSKVNISDFAHVENDNLR